MEIEAKRLQNKNKLLLFQCLYVNVFLQHFELKNSKLASFSVDLSVHLISNQISKSTNEITHMSRSLTVDFILFSLFTLFYFSFLFLFLEQLGLRFISYAVTSVTNWWQSHKTDHGTWENGVEGSGTKWRHTAWKTHASLMLYS